MAETALVWLRNDLRIADNPALSAAMSSGRRVVCVHVEEIDSSLRARGAASRWWLHRSLDALSKDLAKVGVELAAMRGSVLDVVASRRVRAIYWNRRYGPAERKVDAAIKNRLRADGVEAESFPGNALVEPFDIATNAGGPYVVFTRFWRALRSRDIARPLPRPKHAGAIEPKRLDDGYREPNWAMKLGQHWTVGEVAAHRRLDDFLERIADYAEGRDFPARDATSKLSPHLAFGEISARQVWQAAAALAHREPRLSRAVDAFLRELAWRDFNLHQLYHRANIATVPMQEKFAHLRWRRSERDLVAWQRGETGIPIVDAGMRELWETGWMHNRVRMVAASLLSKNLLLDWRLGEQWFWTRWLTPTRRTIRATGNGSRDAEPMRPPSSASSIR